MMLCVSAYCDNVAAAGSYLCECCVESCNDLREWMVDRMAKDWIPEEPQQKSGCGDNQLEGAFLMRYCTHCQVSAFGVLPESPAAKRCLTCGIFYEQTKETKNEDIRMDGVRSDSSAQGVKHDSGKPELALIPPEALFEIGRVLSFGSKKYGPHQWRGGFSWTRLLSAALRHTLAFTAGEDLDPESGLSHLAHAATNLMMLFALTKNEKQKANDDRFGR